MITNLYAMSSENKTIVIVAFSIIGFILLVIIHGIGINLWSYAKKRSLFATCFFWLTSIITVIGGITVLALVGIYGGISGGGGGTLGEYRSIIWFPNQIKKRNKLNKKKEVLNDYVT
ncbi:hypothetical protein [Spiroplasma tabanidicola]|uniref:Uncharacterized protein n=1 Tax=Spiroplasma tabanidicola TaxID=324079 RepID=A0A6I6CJY0_9MOLU|nr:hypothetical protein [Spiroplasma tabanidicola]QGS52403.1 hypothetical protein STABA_v1c10550 [Spiroplasma tabanidicola]